METIGFTALTVTNLAATLIVLFGALSERMRLYPAWHKIGLIVAAAGLGAQAVRNVQFLVTGMSPSDADLPLWALKDVGISIIAFYYAGIAAQSVMQSRRNARAVAFSSVRAAPKRQAAKPKPKPKPKKPTTKKVTQ